MFPIRDDNPTFLKPVVTIGLIGANLLMWAAVQGLGSEPGLSRSICALGLIPAEVLGQFPDRGPVPCPLDGQPAWHTVLSSMFLHGGWMHLIGNMWFLWIFGNNVEDSMGHGRFLAFYLLCGLAAAAAQALSDPSSAIPMVGASGAIGGVMGAYIVLYPRVHVHMLIFLGFFITTFAVPAVWMLGYWLLIQVLGGVMAQGGGGVAFWAHIGGFVGGALLIFLFKNKKLLQRHPYYGWRRQLMPTRSWRKVR